MQSILVEVLSPSTRGVDTDRKLAGYFQLASVSHHLVVDPEMRTVTHRYRVGEGIGTVIRRGEGRLHLEPPGIALAVADLFGSLA